MEIKELEIDREKLRVETISDPSFQMDSVDKTSGVGPFLSKVTWLQPDLTLLIFS